MKKRVLIVLALLLLSLCGCGRNRGDNDAGGGNASLDKADAFAEEYMDRLYSDRVGIQGYKEAYDTETGQLKDSGSTDGRMSFGECEFEPINAMDSVALLKPLYEYISVEESWNTIKGWLEMINATDIDMDKEVRDDSGQFAQDESRESPYCYVAVSEHYDELESGRGFFVNTNECHIQMGGMGVYSMSDGTITRYLGENRHAGIDAVGGIEDEDIIKSGRTEELADEEWELLSGDMTVGDAADAVKRYFKDGVLYPLAEGIELDVPEVTVFALKDKYGYEFSVRRKYRGVPFAHVSNGTRRYYDEYIPGEDTKLAYVVDGGVNAYVGCDDADTLEQKGELQDSIISLKEAVSLLNEKLGEQVEIEVKRVEFAYCPIKELDSGELPFIILPCWQFTGVNLVNKRDIRIYLDALTGDVYYYTYGG